MSKYLIYGYGKSGRAVEQILLSQQKDYRVYDSNIKIDGGIYESNLNRTNILKYHTIILSPAVPINTPIIKFALKHGINVMSELEFGAKFVSCPIIAITGSNGKTTCTRLVCDILKSAGFNARAVGNIGDPISLCYGNTYDFLVVEVSSFQLEATNHFAPNIAVILNITPNHLDRHKDLNEYINIKHKIMQDMTSKDTLVYNIDDKNITPRDNIRLLSFGTGGMCHIREDIVIFNGKNVCKLSGLSPTFTEDYLAAISVAKILKIPNEVIQNTLNNFSLSPHRVELVSNNHGVRFYDDSKSTSIYSTLSALKNFENCSVILLLGGVNKGLNFKELFLNLPSCVTYVLTFGRSGKYIESCCKKYKKDLKVKYFSNMSLAVSYSFTISSINEVVLLSPACASFDEFDSYSARGEEFVRLVKRYDKK